MIGAVILLAIGFGVGIAGIAHSFAGSSGRHRDDLPASSAGGLAGLRDRISTGWKEDSSGPRLKTPGHTGRGAVAGMLVATLVLIVTRWPAVIPVGAAAALGIPVLMRRLTSSTASDRMEAVATWTELLEGTMAASAGLVHALVATAPLAPDPIRPAATHLAARLDAGANLRSALLDFAREVDDPAADRVVCALLMASGSRAQKLGDLLGALAAATREDVAMRLRIDASRASVISGTRTVVIFSVAFAAGLMLLARSYLAPFGSAAGQVILVVIGLLYASGLILIVSIAAPTQSIRLLPTSTGGPA